MEIKIAREKKKKEMFLECVIQKIKEHEEEEIKLNMYVDRLREFLILTDIENTYLMYIYGTPDELSEICERCGLIPRELFDDRFPVRGATKC